MTIDPMRRTVSASANKLVQRLQEADAERARARAAAGEDTRPTHERLAEHALAGARADEALRERARVNAAKARGEWVPGDEDDEDEETDDEPEGERDPVDSSERRSARAAWRNSTR